MYRPWPRYCNSDRTCLILKYRDQKKPRLVRGFLLKEILNYQCYKLAMMSNWFYKNNLSRMNDFGGHRNVPEPTYQVLLNLYLSKQCYPFVISVE